ncbi:MAG: dihydrofolate reductase family protein [Verrucomicrobiota bacterium JB022]|nr:dihydrofolate reductase family protein [Verrucomicrobiota bacterium JB022]
MRPKIISHMISSIDGRLLVDRWTPPAASIDRDDLFAYYDQIADRFQADGWMAGRKSMEEYAGTSSRPAHADGPIPRETFVADRQGRAVGIALDPHGKIHYGGDNAHGDHVIAILGEAVSDDYLAELRQDGVSYLFAGPDGHDLPRALECLRETFGLKTLLLQGGGVINGAFLKAGLIDEISVLIYPGIDGLAGMPGIFEYLGAKDDLPAAGKALRHLATETLEGGVVWLHYRVEDATA